MTEMPEGWEVIHRPTPPLQLPPTAGHRVGTVIRHKASGRQYKLTSDQREGDYWMLVATEKNIDHE